MDDLPSDAPSPRLCYVRKWPDFNGYGFNLHAERGKAGQYIGTVDDNSPAVAAGLRAGDRIIEVNDTNIGSENHQQVVQRIKAVADETKLLVVDAETDAYYKERKMVVRGDMPNVIYNESPADNPYTNPVADVENDMNSMKIEEQGPLVYEAGYEPRLCHLLIWPDFAGYGFNLHADRTMPGQYIGKVDDDSPAEAGGLRVDDRIIEVNGSSVLGKSHADVVTEIKAIPDRVSLLVVDMASDQYYRDQKVEISGSLPNVVTISCPEKRTISAEVNGDHKQVEEIIQQVEDHRDSYEESKLQTEDEEGEYEREYENTTIETQMEDIEPAMSQVTSPSYSEEMSEPTPQPVASASASTTTAGKPAVLVGGLEFAGSAKEARERMKKKGSKQNPNLSIRDKYELLQKL